MERAVRSARSQTAKAPRAHGHLPRDPGGSIAQTAARTGKVATAHLDYSIVVPSRGRPDNCARVLALLPNAMICVDERERDDYRKHVPSKQLLVHPPSTGAPAARNWIIENVTASCLIQCDD